MATVNILSNGSHPGGGGLQATLDYCMQDEKTMYEGQKLVYGMNCSEQDPYLDMMTTKKLYGKTGGRMYYHLDQSFSPDEKITPEQAHKIAIEFAEEQFKGYEVLIATHVDAHHIHSHFVVNSVSFENGLKYHSSKDNIRQLREASDTICLKHGFSVVKPKEQKKTTGIGTREYRVACKSSSWKMNLIVAIEAGMRRAKTKDEFLDFMKKRGYEVNWTDTRKYITYTTPNGYRCRDIRLHEDKFLKEAMENEFRIRQEIARSETYCGSEFGRGAEADTMLYDHTGKLEGTPNGVLLSTGADGEDGYSRADGSILRGTEGVLREKVGLVGSENGGDKAGNAGSGEELEGRDGSTGWESERAICFSFGENAGENGEKDAGEYGETVSPDTDAFSAYDIACSSAYLAADIMSIFDSQPKEDETPHPHPVRERKNRQKDDRDGPVMSM
ncbi:MAG: relaxase/mobilization nuclease domain-containing protein [Clostridiales bacterium]|nr:relaxase/mobilization nuclease domain-containing protein [Clostridiales bacterium]